MRLTLDLKNRSLNDDDRNFWFNFKEWEFTPNRGGQFTLDNLTINRSEISEVIFREEKEVITFEADYEDGEASNLYIISDTTYDRKMMTQALDLFLDAHLSRDAVEVHATDGEASGEVEVFYDYNESEFVFRLTRFVVKPPENRIQARDNNVVRDKVLIERLVRHLNKAFAKSLLDAVVDYSEGIGLRVDNYLDESEQRHLERESKEFLLRYMSEEDYLDRVFINTEWNSFSLEIE